jgi:cell division inhibitor SulA
MNRSLQQKQSNPNTGVTEVVLPGDIESRKSEAQLTMVLPMLAHLSHQAKDRWFSWIAPKGISKQILNDYGFDLSKVRLIHTRSEEETLWVLWQALAEGNSEAVVASPGRLTDKAFNSLEQAASYGNSQGLLIRYR